jgi:hypothetical protein
VTEVSVVIPTHNRCQLLELTLRSVFEQRNVAFEASLSTTALLTTRVDCCGALPTVFVLSAN